MKKIALSVVLLTLLGVSSACAATSSSPEANGVVAPDSTSAAPSAPVAEDPPRPTNSVDLAQAAGQFVTVDQDHPTTGTARLVSENGQRYLVFDAAFDTARGPDVQVVLYSGAEVPVNLTEDSYITLAPLQSFSGAQQYLIPADVNLSDYQAVGIWCRQFDVTFGYAPISG